MDRTMDERKEESAPLVEQNEPRAENRVQPRVARELRRLDTYTSYNPTSDIIEDIAKTGNEAANLVGIFEDLFALLVDANPKDPTTMQELLSPGG